MNTPDETDIDYDTLYNEFINATRTAARQALIKEKEEREIRDAKETLLELLAYN